MLSNEIDENGNILLFRYINENNKITKEIWEDKNRNEIVLEF